LGDNLARKKGGYVNDNVTIIVIIILLLLLCCCLALTCAMCGGTVMLITALAETPTPTVVPHIIYTPVPTPMSDEQTTEDLVTSVFIPERDLRALATRLNHPSEPIPEVVSVEPPNYQVGDTEVFWVGNLDTNEQFTVTARLRYLTPHLYMWVQEGYSVNDQALSRSAERFESGIYPTNREFFGSEWTPGVDNDVHLHILHAADLGFGVAGYYSSADEYSHLANPYSNEREMFYLAVDNISPGTDFYDGVLAHEFQHMIHWYNDRNEDGWVNEGCSELASYLNHHDVGDSPQAFINQPDVQLTTWSVSSEESYLHYGASYLLMAYFLDRFGEEATRAVVAQDANGIAGFNAVLSEYGLTFDQVLADWLVANLLDDPGLEDERYGYAELGVGPVRIDYTHRTYPAQRASTVHQYAADYIEFLGKGDLTIQFTGSTQVRLTDTDAHSGRYMWYSMRGDDSDMTLTRPFDLTGLEQATLRFWTWHDIEEDWDYAYVEVSPDGGQTWDILPGTYTTDYNPNGNSFGQAYTGVSGGGEVPRWVQEQVDLTSYAGKQVLIRFEYVTDDAVNRPGLLIDDISIPELGYADDAENGDGSWEADGFVRVDNVLPQRFIVQLVTFGQGGKPLRVERMVLDELQRGRLELRGLGTEMERAVLIVSGIAPVTTEWASYEYKVD
jgi:immune inhibitor A